MFATRVNPGPRLPSFSELMLSIAHRPFPPPPQAFSYDHSELSNHHHYVLARPSVTLQPQASKYTPAPLVLKPELEMSSTSPTPTSQPSQDLPTPPASTELRDKLPEQEIITAPKRKHACKTCGRSFTTLGHLARHNRTHTGERKHMCPWPQCGARFARQDNCMQHYKTHMNGKGKRHRMRR